ncbi:MAG: C15orf41 family protein [Methanomassiliicoccaceae archaeon]|nr:C15orf41 family protein [Methanomassiliicoccaceae archaeon]
MQYEEYKKIYDSLNKPEDLCRLLEMGYDSRLLETLYTQKISRDVKKRFHFLRDKSPLLLKEWKKGKTLMEIADKYKFPPILTAMIIFQEDGASKKQFWEFIRSPDTLESQQTADEVRDVIKNDLVYSPQADERHKERGLWGEGLLQGWLNEQNIVYKTENDLRGHERQKTPDCLLSEPMLYCGKKICWIESKASFGDNVEFRYNSRKQLCPYTELFGPGLVIYWTGCLEDLEWPEDVYVSDISVLEKKLEKITE